MQTYSLSEWGEGGVFFSWIWFSQDTLMDMGMIQERVFVNSTSGCPMYKFRILMEHLRVALNA
jgi:hypothetical protein